MHISPIHKHDPEANFFPLHQSSSITNFRQMLNTLKIKNTKNILPSTQSPQIIRRKQSSHDSKQQQVSSKRDEALPIKTKFKKVQNNEMLNSDYIFPKISVKKEKQSKRNKVRGSRTLKESDLQLNVCKKFFPKFQEVKSEKKHERYSIDDFSSTNGFMDEINVEQKNVHQEMNISKNSCLVQRRFNISIINCRKIEQISEQFVIAYCNKHNTLCHQSQPQQIKQFFQDFLSSSGIFLKNPMIRKYRNCIYFGDDQQGIILYFKNKIYYGNLSALQKHGKGVQIQFHSQIPLFSSISKYGCNKVFRGQFHFGKKTGNFLVHLPSEIYEGFLQDGFYQGQGKLTTSQFIYEGQFWKGYKHGIGKQSLLNNNNDGNAEVGCFYKGRNLKSTKLDVIRHSFKNMPDNKNDQRSLISQGVEQTKKNKIQKVSPEKEQIYLNIYDQNFDFESCKSTEPRQDSPEQLLQEGKVTNSQSNTKQKINNRKNTTQVEQPLPLPSSHSKMLIMAKQLQMMIDFN